MFHYVPQNQLSIFDFKTEFESKLDPNNRWVILANLLDWDKFATIYSKAFRSKTGKKSIDARIIIGALIIKHIEAKDDRGTIAIIQENPYMQFFLGFDHFHFEPIFDPSLFVHIRKRLGSEAFDQMNQTIIKQALEAEVAEKEEVTEKSDKKALELEVSEKEQLGEDLDKELPQNKGKLQLDATVCDAHIKYPTDLSLLNDSREKSEEIIAKLCQTLALPKPRTYRQVARKEWLKLAKSKKNTKNKIRTGVKKQLNYLNRNLKSIDKIIKQAPKCLSKLDAKEYRYLLIISELYRQQREMFLEKKNQISNRIVSIHQPHIRPIVRGKQGKSVEFGAKVNVSLQNGYARVDQINFEAFNEGIYLQEQVENYKKLHRFYPELVQADEIYMTRANRKFLKDNNIRHTGKPLGRKPKEHLTKQAAQQLKQERNERNHIEGKFGQGKGKYKLNKIMARLSTTSESWIATIFFVLNILKLSKDIFVPILNWFNAWVFNILFNKKRILYLEK